MMVQEIVDSIPLPHPLNLPQKEKIAALRAMSPAERMDISFRLSTEYRKRWRAWLRSQFPAASEEEFRMIVIGRLLEEGEEERQVAARCAERSRNRTEPNAK